MHGRRFGVEATECVIQCNFREVTEDRVYSFLAKDLGLSNECWKLEGKQPVKKKPPASTLLK